ncbi:GntR family transcriptional regulator [Polaribacter reichenbachii]|uniref:GntR family transcriptional regulator n=1 Tax=Polaribacter reichenbachii TaxID=996801 RepID=A0A1B8U7E9_9FLAO|nr:PLP-dependent aminotransferase family protein [Polaribacter reichenbachii]APZ46463.1 GntR family transcriptional regulator [Polaribacter reichenbachii]AUC20328.1 GntR family transcriptional regulator [Polaribacter reichenbachii]OBY67770.1 GntR family transcriptional regulator [Polaribacter reichenbachii]
MTDSPLLSIIQKNINFDKSKTQAIYIQGAQAFVNLFQRNIILKKTKLPGTRALAKTLQIHRNTAVAIYDELASQGWVDIKPNRGTFVSTRKVRFTNKNKKTEFINNQSLAKTTGFEFQKSFHLASTVQLTTAKYSVNDGKPDLRLHPVNQFTRWYSAAMKRKTLIQKWNRPQEASLSMFQTQLCNYLNATRGLYVSPKNLISTRSTEMSLYIVSQLLIQKNDVVLVGNLSNYASNMIFQQVGAQLITIPVDDEGLDIDFIRKNFIKNSIRCVYICAHRDYPTTVTLSEKRRTALLKLAKEFGFAIIEDDFDYDFQFDNSPVLPMTNSDENGMVIYLGKLGQSLFPSFQTGFVIAPENLIQEAKNYLYLLDEQGDLIQQQMLSELINEGEIYRLMQKNIVIYKKRRDYLNRLLLKHFDKIAAWKIPEGGLAIWLTFTPTIPLVKLAEQAEKNDLFLPKTILYQNKTTCAIRFGFGHLNEEEIEIVIHKLKSAYNNLSLS